MIEKNEVLKMATELGISEDLDFTLTDPSHLTVEFLTHTFNEIAEQLFGVRRTAIGSFMVSSETPDMRKPIR